MPAKKPCKLGEENCLIVVFYQKNPNGKKILGAELWSFGTYEEIEAKRLAAKMAKSVSANPRVGFEALNYEEFNATYGVASSRFKRSPGGTCDDEIISCKKSQSEIIHISQGLITSLKNLVSKSKCNACSDDLKSCKANQAEIMKLSEGLIKSIKNLALKSDTCIPQSEIAQQTRNIAKFSDDLDKVKSNR